MGHPQRFSIGSDRMEGEVIADAGLRALEIEAAQLRTVTRNAPWLSPLSFTRFRWPAADRQPRRRETAIVCADA